MTPAASALLVAIRRLGSDAQDLRDAAHEACHALQWNLRKKWTRTNVERANPYRRRSQFSFGLADEITARAVEQIVCVKLGEKCSTLEASVLSMCMETASIDRIQIPYDPMVKAVRERMKDPAVLKLADRVIALAESAELRA